VVDSVDVLPGDDWDFAIQRALRNSRVVIACLSPSSITKEGYVQKEISIALDVALEKPEAMVYIIPARLRARQIVSQDLDGFSHRAARRSSAMLLKPKPGSLPDNESRVARQSSARTGHRDKAVIAPAGTIAWINVSDSTVNHAVLPLKLTLVAHVRLFRPRLSVRESCHRQSPQITSRPLALSVESPAGHRRCGRGE
jgi:hypothetical protein